MQTGLNIFENTNNRKIALDADNVFWSILPKSNNGSTIIPRNVLSSYNRIGAGLDREMRDFRFGVELSAVYIDPTDRCNANCPYCYVPPKIRRDGRSMTKNELELILNKIYQYIGLRRKKLVIVFHASEPLLVKDVVFSAIEKFKDKFLFGLQTNGILLEKEDVEFLIKNRVGVGLSLDSYSRKINNRLRSGNFNKVIKALEWFDGYAGLNVITTLTKYNVANLSKIVKFMHNKKVPCLLLNPMRFTQKYSRKLKPDENALTKEFIKAVDTAIALTQKTGRQIIIANFANILLGIVSPFARRLMCDISPCGGGRCFFTITAKGEMIPCGEFIGLKDFSGGNIFKGGIKQALDSAPFKKVRGRFVENVEECNLCEFRNICGSPCPAELYSLGKFRQKSVFCNFYKAIIRHAFKLIAQGKEKYILRKELMNNLRYEYRA
ncbi:MAG: peptide-modifying radical SAM enzyme CbpB [Candidatus Omnitrophota bacterium]